MNQSMLSGMGDNEFLSYCETLSGDSIEEIGMLLGSAISRLQYIEKYGCGDCTTCDDMSDDDPDNVINKIKSDLEDYRKCYGIF